MYCVIIDKNVQYRDTKTYFVFALNFPVENDFGSQLAALLIDREFLRLLNILVADFQMIAHSSVLAGIFVYGLHSHHQVIRVIGVLQKLNRRLHSNSQIARLPQKRVHTSGTSTVALGSSGITNSGLFLFIETTIMSTFMMSKFGPLPAPSRTSTSRW